MGLQRRALRHIHLHGEEIADEVGDAHILPDADRGRGIDLDHDVDVAVRPGLPASDGPEQRRMRHALETQRRLIGAQGGDDGVAGRGKTVGRKSTGGEWAVIGGKIIARETARALR